MEQAHVGVHQDLGDLIEIPGQRKRQHPGIAVLHVATQQDRGPEGLLKLSLQVHFQLSERGVVRRGPGGDRFGKGQRVARRRYGQSPRKRGLEEGLEKGPLQGFRDLEVVVGHHPQQLAVTGGQGNAHHRLQQHQKHPAGALVGGGHEGASDLGVGEAGLGHGLVQAWIAMLQVGKFPAPIPPMAPAERHPQAACQLPLFSVHHQQMPVVVIPTIEIHPFRPVGRNVAVTAGTHLPQPFGQAGELGRGKQVGLQIAKAEAELACQVAAEQVGFRCPHPAFDPLTSWKDHPPFRVRKEAQPSAEGGSMRETQVPARVVLLHHRSGSTIDHFLRLPLEKLGWQLLERDGELRPAPGDAEALAGASLIVVVRTLPAPWLRLLRQRHRQGGARLVYLLDDDLLDPASLRELPAPYRRRLMQRITGRRRQLVDLLQNLFDGLWVTSETLAEKYAFLGAELLPLAPHSSLLAEAPRLQLAYLGTASHQAEFRWLLSLLEPLQQRHRHTPVDLFGDLSINRLFRHLPRVRVIHPMGWENYLAETGNGRIDLLLCPLLESPFNRARAAVKFIDAARTGAVGLFSDRQPYRGFVRNGVDGLLLADDPALWLEALERLISEPAERRQLAAACRHRALGLGERAPALAIPFPEPTSCRPGAPGQEGHGIPL